ncbi:retrovirus-related pol polyprotein from transposon TNT 1-94 [Tanacetum coccineum]
MRSTAIEELKDLTSLSLDELIGNLKVHGMIIKKDSEIICLGVDLEPDEWIKDSGCSKHMTGNRKLFSTYKAYNGGNVIFGSNLCGNIIGKCTISNDSFKIDNVEHVDNLGFNLLSIGQICDNKCKVTFSEHDSEITKNGKVIGRGIRKKGLHVMKLGNKQKDQICLAAIDENSTLWHRRLGYANMHLIQSLASKELVRNLPKFKFDQHFCDACKIGKQAHVSHKAKNIVSTTRFLELIHMDIFGPSAVRSYGGNRYTLVIIDDYSRKIEESLNVTFDETPPPSKTSPLVDDDLDEEEAIREIKKKNLENIVEDETLEIDEIVNIKESRNHPLENNVNEALGDESWIVAMQEELNQFIANDVWELVPQPKNMTIIGTKWVFRNKLDENGVVSRNKARLVAQGYNQQEGIDYDETYAPVARLESIRILLAYACALDFKLFQMDVKSAFLNGFINEEVYVAQPPGFIDFEKPDHVYKLKKALYGLKQAPKAWYDRLKAFLKHEYKMGMVDNTLFTKKKSSNLIIVQIYVDDIIFGSTCQDMCDEFAKIMHDEFEMSMMGELNFFLGLQIKQMEDDLGHLMSWYNVPFGKAIQTNLPVSFDDIISYVREDREGQVTRIRHQEEIEVQNYQILTREIVSTLKPLEEIIQENVFCLGGNRDHVPACLCYMLYCVANSEKFNLAYFMAKRMEWVTKQARLILPYGMLLTRLFDFIISEYPELKNESYVLYDRVMTPLAAQLERKPRRDRGTRRGRRSTSSSSDFDQPSSTHLNDDDDEWEPLSVQARLPIHDEEVTTTPSPTTTSSSPTPPNAPSKTPSTNQTSSSQDNTSSYFQSKLQTSPSSSHEPTSPQTLNPLLENILDVPPRPLNP